MLHADRVTVVFGRGRWSVRAVSDVSLSLAPGQRLGLTGPSGSGKTTLAQVLSLLRRPDGGQVSLDGTPVRGGGLSVPRTLRQRVQLLWQSPRAAVDPRMRLQQVILEPLAAAGALPVPAQRRRTAVELAETVGLAGELLSRYPHEVSDGQLQRAALARALVVDPGYLICDEPTAMLDVSSQASLLETIAAVQSRHGTGVLLITHDRLVAEHWSDMVVDIADCARPTRP